MKPSDLFYGYTMPLFHCVTRMGWRGVLINQSAVKELGSELDKKIETLSVELDSYTGERINVKSGGEDGQVAKFLYGTLGLRKHTHHKTGKITTDNTALEKLYSQTHHRAIKLILLIREKRTLRENFVSKPLDYDGRWRTTYSVSGTDTYRLSGKKTVFGTGSSLMNIPRPPDKDDPEVDLEGTFIRKCMVASPGKELMEADKSQAEARLTAWFAQDSGMKNIFKTNQDIHRWNASVIFKKAPNDISKTERYFAKRVVHGFDYGLGVDHLRDIAFQEVGLSLSRRECEEIRNTYFAGCPAIPAYHKWVENEIDKKGYLTNPFGFRMWFFGRPGVDRYRKGYARLPQSTCTMDLNMGMIRVDLQLPVGAELLMQVHDSIVIEYYPDQRNQIIDLLHANMESPITIHNDPLVIPIEIKVGKNWGEMESVK